MSAGNPARLARAAIGWLVALGAIVSGVGVLYLLRADRIAGVGPLVGGALPLQQLAGGESQPLARMVVAWVPAGLVAGLALARLTGLRARTRIALLGLLAAILLLYAGALADAVAISDPVGPHLTPQLGRTGTWIAVAFLLAGTLLHAASIKPRHETNLKVGANRGNVGTSNRGSETGRSAAGE